MRVFIILFAFIALIAGTTSCGSNSDAKLLIPVVTYTTDTMLNNRKEMIELEMDSLCAVHQEAYIQSAVDSLLKIERARIKQLTR